MAKLDPQDRKLTDKQARFVEEYLIDLSPTEAARRAGYKASRYLSRAGFDVLRKPQVQAAIQAAQKARSQRLGITADRVVAELAAVAFAKITDVISWQEGQITIIDSEMLEESSKKSIAEVKQTVDGSLQVKLHDKNQALDKLCRHLGLYDADRHVVDNISSDGSCAMPSVIRLVGPDGESGDWDLEAENAA